MTTLGDVSELTFPSTQRLDNLICADTLDHQWLTRTARALDELLEFLVSLKKINEGEHGRYAELLSIHPELSDQVRCIRADHDALCRTSRSLRVRLVEASTDLSLAPVIRAELVIVTTDTCIHFRRLRRLSWSAATASPEAELLSA